MKVTQHPTRNLLVTQRGGGCVGCIGTAFALWAILLGSMVVAGWRAGDFTNETVLIAGLFLGTFFLCGLGIATWRDRYRFENTRGAITRLTSLFFVPYHYRRWLVEDFEAVELFLFARRRNGVTSRIHVVRLRPAAGGPASEEPRELGSGEAGKEMREKAREVAEFAGLPLRETRSPDT